MKQPESSKDGLGKKEDDADSRSADVIEVGRDRRKTGLNENQRVERHTSSGDGEGQKEQQSGMPEKTEVDLKALLQRSMPQQAADQAVQQTVATDKQQQVDPNILGTLSDDSKDLLGKTGDDDSDSLSSDVIEAGRDRRKTGLTENQRVERQTSSGEGEGQKEQEVPVEEKNEDTRKLIEDIRSRNSSDHDVIEETSDKKVDKKDEDRLDVMEKKDDHNKDNEIERASGGRIVSTTSSSDMAGGGGRDDSRGKRDQAQVVEMKVVEVKQTKEEAVADYTDNFRKYLLNPKKDLVGVADEEQKLQKDFGVTSRQLKDIQMAVKKSIKANIRDTIKDAILNKQLTMLNKFDNVTADTKLNNFTEYFVNNMLLGGTEFGNFDDNFQGLINRAMYHASKDLADFAIDELQDFVTSKSIDPNTSKEDRIRTFENKVNDLNAITNNPKITEEWAQTAMEGFMKNFGLSKDEMPQGAGEQTGLSVNVQTGDTGSGGQQQPKERQLTGYEYDQKDERAILINRLRALYLQQALQPGMINSLQTEFKIRKLKNGLYKLGIYTDVLNQNVKEEAEEQAKDRLRDMLKEALHERASLYDLKGPAYDLVEAKIKGVLKDGEKVGFKISGKEFDSYRDEANKRMYEITKKESEMIGVRLSDADLPQLVVRHREMEKLMKRLKEESNIQDNSEPAQNNEMFRKMTVVETA